MYGRSSSSHHLVYGNCYPSLDFARGNLFWVEFYIFVTQPVFGIFSAKVVQLDFLYIILLNEIKQTVEVLAPVVV